MTITVPNINNQYSLRTPAHRFVQGGRDVYCFTLDLRTLDGLLPHRVDNDVVHEANRRLTPSHAKKIEMYVDERDDWLSGSMLLGIGEKAIDFHPYPDENGQDNPNIGELRIRGNWASTMRIFDGQHRRKAISDLLRRLADDDERSDKYEALIEESIPIVLYVEDDVVALRQMFADASKTKSIEANTVTMFDQRDAFNLTALRLAEESKLFCGRVEMERSTVSRTSQRLIAVNQLASTLKTLDVGYNGRVRKDRNDAHLVSLDQLYGRCEVWADEFLPAARWEYQGLLTGEISIADIPRIRTTSFAYNATVIRILAGCYHEWCKDGSDWRTLALFFKDACLEPNRGSGALLVDAGAVAPGGATPFARIQEVTKAIDYIVDQARK